MNVFSSFLLGLVQGVAEFLPISSSGHLAIAQNLLQIDAEVPEFFDVLLHLGTLGAVFVAYWQAIKDMIAEFFRGIGDLAHRSTPKPLPPARRLILLIILGTLPLFAVLPIKDKVLGAVQQHAVHRRGTGGDGLPAIRQRPGEEGEKERADGVAAGRGGRGCWPGHRHGAGHLPVRHDHHLRVLRGL